MTSTAAAATAFSGPVASRAFEGADAGLGAFTAAQDEASRALYGRLRRAIWQNEQEDVPLEACLCALILAIEPNIAVSKVVEAMPAHPGQLGIPELLNIMISLGYKAQQGAVELAEIDRRLLPCVFLPFYRGEADPGDAIVVLSIDKSPEGPVATVFNGREAKTRQLPLELADARKLGRAFFFQPAKRAEDSNSPEMRAQTGYTWFSATLFRFKRSFWQLTAIGITLSLVGLGTPLFIMLVYDRVISPRSLEPLGFLVVGVVLSISMEWMLRSLRSHTLSWLTARLDYVIGTTVFERLIQLPPAIIERASVAAQVARVKTFESVRDFFSGPVFMSVIELPSIIVSLAALTWFGGPLALVPLGVTLAYVALFVFVRWKVTVSIRLAAKATSKTQQFSIETFDKLETIRGNGLSSVWLKKYQELSGRENVAQFRLYFWGMIGETLAHALTLVAAVATLSLGVVLVWDGWISAGVLVAGMILTWRVLMPFNSLCTMVPRFEQLRNAIQQINDLMDVPTEAESDEISARLPEIRGQVSFANAGLRYSREAGPVFLGLNVEIRPGEIIVVSGSNGAGKSSVLKLVQGLYAPVTGAVRIDGFDIRQLVQRDLRQLIGYVPQSPDFVIGTIAENLRFARPLAGDEELWRVLEQVGAADEVAGLPDGLATQVGDGSEHTMSSSLGYRLAFARALLLNSRLLLIDEQPNAILNIGIGDLLKDLLRDSRGQRTVIFVSHRVDLMRLADRVIRLRRGQPPLCGPLDQFLEQPA